MTPPSSSAPGFDARIALVLRGGVGAAIAPVKTNATFTAEEEVELRHSLHAHGLDRVAELELAIVPAIAAMAEAGVRVDRASWVRLVEARQVELDTLGQDVRGLLGLRAVTDAAVVAGLRAHGVNVTKTGRTTLLPFADNPAVAAVIRYNRLKSFLNDQAKGILRALDASPDGRVRAQFDQLGAVTGRMTTTQPNLLGLPRDEVVRACFIPADGYVFVSADYNALELRVAAALAHERVLLELFAHGGDPHAMTAARLHRKDVNAVTPQERKGVKPANFGAIYGIGAQALVGQALDAGVVISLAEAQAMLDAFRTTYPALTRWQRAIADDMAPMMRTRLGRLRRFGDLDGAEARMNFPVQGAAADGMKAALKLLHPALAAHGARLLLVVHDETLVEVPVAEAEEVKDLVVERMISGMLSVVPEVVIAVDADIRRSWASEASAP